MNRAFSVLVSCAVSGIGGLLVAHPHGQEYGPFSPPDGQVAKNDLDRPWANDLFVETRPQPVNGLAGRKVIISAGHGRTWNEQNEWWGWQRDAVHFGEVEDLITPRIVNRWLVKYFENAGANVVTTRERDEQLHEVYLDDAHTTTTVTGEWNVYTDESGGNTSPWMGRALTAPTQSEPGGLSVTWHATIPEMDRYGLRIWYPEIPNATSNAVLIVHGAAADVRVEINQQRNQGRWLWIDEFVFPAGDNVPIATMTTESADLDALVIADGIRLGGGMGDFDAGGGVSGLPRWQEYSKSWSITYGAPPLVWDRFVVASDFSVRWAYLQWEPVDLFYEVHTNASGTPEAQQTGTQVFWTQAPTQEQLDIFEQGHLAMIQMIREHWYPTWRNDGFFSPQVTGSPSINALVEVAYHDRLDPDLLSLLNPEFRRLASRAMYQKAAAALTFGEVVFLPEPPEAPAVENLGGGAVRLSWEPPAWGPEVDSYRVFESADGVAFDLGLDVGDVLSIERDGFSAGDMHYFQIRAINAGGRSFPTETVGVRVGDGEPMLVVNGFNRFDRLVQEADNPRNFVRHYIAAFGAADDALAIDSAANEAVESDRVALQDKHAVAWILGKESTADETFSASEQHVVAEYLDAGGRLFVSGTDIAHDLIETGTQSDRQFARTKLFLGSAGTRTTNRDVTGAEGTPFAGLSFTLSGANQKPYHVDEADVLAVDISGFEAFRWGVGSGAAGVAYEAGPSKALTMSAPFEAILGEEKRAEVAASILDFLRSPVQEDTTPPTIINLRVTAIGPDRATILWRTNEPATSVVRWGPEETLDNTDLLPGGETLNHRFDLTGLLPSTTYYYSVQSTDFFGNAAFSEIREFTTQEPDTDPPIISNVEVLATSDRDAIIRFVTNEPATTGAQWGTNPESLTGSASIPDVYKTIHFLRVSPLLSNRTYHFKAISSDLAGNEGESAVYTLQTLPSIDAVIVDNVDPGYSDTGWTIGAFGTQMIGSDYAWISTSPGGAHLAEWEAPVPIAGYWQAHTNYTSGANRSNAAPYAVISPGDVQHVAISQQSGGGVWQILGSERFYGEDDPLYVTLANDTDASGVVIADATRWTFVRLSAEAFEELESPEGWMLY